MKTKGRSSAAAEEQLQWQTAGYHMTEKPMDIKVALMSEPTSEIAELMNIWENDPDLFPFIRPLASEDDLHKKKEITVESLKRRLESHEEYVIYLRDRPVGQLSVQIDPGHLAKKVKGTAWIGIYIGEKENRGKGAGTYALKYVEGILRSRHIRRIELGVFEFNKQAYRLYERLGYKEFTRLDELAWWQGGMWRDIRMEKYLE
jgi:RimJ/RimL family protein N-acetyltransferase